MQPSQITTTAHSANPNLLILSYRFFNDIFEYREYFRQSIARDLRRRYKRSFLGYVWSMLNPLLMMIILAVVFSNIMKQNIKDYAIFLYSGSIAWTYFNNTILASLGTIRANANIINQVKVPLYLFPLSIAFSGLMDVVFSLAPLLLIMFFIGHEISYHAVALPIVVVPLFLVTVGVSLAVSVANVFFEDTEHLVSISLRALYFLCPILYQKEMLPGWLVKWVVLNPMFGIIEFFQDIFFSNRFPNISSFFYIFFSSLLVFFLGLLFFSKFQKKLIYHL